MEEVEEVPITPTITSIAAEPTSIPVVPVVGTPQSEIEEAEAEYTIMQKGLFLAVILGCVAFYVRMNRKSKKFMEKSVV